MTPDFGPMRLDPAAGGVIVGSRPPLIAFNVNLVGANVEAAREIAAVVRERDGGFPGVRALGLDLPSAGQAQVSMNVEDWEASPLHEIVAAVEREAAARGIEVAGAELVGLMPAGAAAAAAGALSASTASTRLGCSSCACSTTSAGSGRRPSGGGPFLLHGDAVQGRFDAIRVPARTDDLEVLRAGWGVEPPELRGRHAGVPGGLGWSAFHA